MSRPVLHFWFEFASTYSYLSAMRVEAAAEDAGADLVWHPFFLGPIFASMGWTTSPFNLYPAKGAYMWRDMERLCAARDLPLTRPDPFPQNSILAARTALLALRTPQGPAFCKAVYRAEFAKGLAISDAGVLRDCLARCDLPETLIDEAATPEAKQALKDSVEQATALGIFGAPSFIANGELYWGDDRLDHALAHLTG